MAAGGIRGRSMGASLEWEARVRHGVAMPNFGDYGDARRLAELAAEAEAADWDGFFLWTICSRLYRARRSRSSTRGWP
jgi:hypothetical protein